MWWMCVDMHAGMLFTAHKGLRFGYYSYCVQVLICRLGKRWLCGHGFLGTGSSEILWIFTSI